MRPKSKVQPMFISSTRAARILGIGQRTLGRLAQQHELYQPLCSMRPAGRTGKIGGHSHRYHAKQIALISAVWIGEVDLDTAGLRLQVLRNQLRTEALS